MTAPAWMPLYIADYLADTAHLSAAEHGAYLLLIMHYWRAGSLPHDDKKLARIARCTDRQWRDMRDTIVGLFGPEWTHKRVENELDKARSKSQARSEAGKHGAEAKALKNKDAAQAIARPLPEQKPAIVQASSSESQSEKEEEEETRSRASYPSEFELLWDCYPKVRNSSKLKAFKAWKDLPSREKDFCLDGVGAFIDDVEKRRRSWPQFEPCHLVTYINQRRWESLLEDVA